LGLNDIQNAAGLRVKTKSRIRVPDVRNRLARNRRYIDVGRRGDFPRYDANTGRYENLTGDAGLRILRQNGVENGVRNVVGDFVWMSLGNGLGRKQMSMLMDFCHELSGACLGLKKQYMRIAGLDPYRAIHDVCASIRNPGSQTQTGTSLRIPLLPQIYT
jgi:hypothetical protein